MKRLFITLLLSLLAVTAVVLWRGWPHLFPSSDVSDLYRRYEHNDFIRVSEIHDLPINDTLAVETLLLEASTDSAWYALLSDFGAPQELIELYQSNRNLFMGGSVNSITLLYIDKNHLGKFLPKTDPDSRMVIVSFEKRSMSVFMTENNNIQAIVQLSEIIKLNNKKQ